MKGGSSGVYLPKDLGQRIYRHICQHTLNVPAVGDPDVIFPWVCIHKLLAVVTFASRGTTDFLTSHKCVAESFGLRRR